MSDTSRRRLEQTYLIEVESLEHEVAGDVEEEENDAVGDGDKVSGGNSSNSDTEPETSEPQDFDEDQHHLQPDQPVETTSQSRIGGWSLIKALLVRTLFIYLVSSLFRRGTQPPSQTGQPTTNVSQLASNLFERGTLMDLYVYISEAESQVDSVFNHSAVWIERNLTYGDWRNGPNGDGSYTKAVSVNISERVQNNGSLYIHVYFVKTGHSPDPSDADRYSPLHMVHKSKLLNKYMRRGVSLRKRLLEFSAVEHNSTGGQEIPEILSFWHPNLTINIVDDQRAGLIERSLTGPVHDYVEIIPELNQYYPIVYINDYWNMNSEYLPINSSTSELELRLTFQPLTLFHWQIYAAQRMRSQLYTLLGESPLDQDNGDDDRAQDSLKRMFLDTNPYLLGVTIIVSILHTLFEFLAFKNDVEFWRSRTSLAGLSIKSVFYGVFQSIVTLLYIIDNESSPIVRITVLIAVAVELWKLFKAVDITVDHQCRWFGAIPHIKITDKSSYVESHTKYYDKVAFRYVTWTLLPLFGAYALYSMFYVEHRSWYSWLISVLYGFLLTFSFIGMMPQLFINYKLKSVAHLPWRTLTYKALNTDRKSVV